MVQGFHTDCAMVRMSHRFAVNKLIDISISSVDVLRLQAIKMFKWECLIGFVLHLAISSNIFQPDFISISWEQAALSYISMSLRSVYLYVFLSALISLRHSSRHLILLKKKKEVLLTLTAVDNIEWHKKARRHFSVRQKKARHKSRLIECEWHTRIVENFLFWKFVFDLFVPILVRDTDQDSENNSDPLGSVVLSNDVASLKVHSVHLHSIHSVAMPWFNIPIVLHK